MLIRLAIRNLLRNPRRTVAVLLTIAMGTGSLQGLRTRTS
jgi:hypothetical protein